jgi:ATP-dependent Clp protease, protease subunit
MFKPYLKSIVRNGGKGRMGLGVELFRLDGVAEEELTVEEFEEAEATSSTAIMRIYEDIGEDFFTGGGVTVKKFAEELDSFGDIKNLHIHINSLGGDAFTAQGIHSVISDHKSRKTAYIDGVAASAATIIACSANEVVARANTSYMIHYPWSLAIGDAETMRKAANDLDKITVPIVNVYKAQVRDKIDEERIRELMEDETWMTADEALEYGFVDRIKGKINAIAKVSKSQILCSGKVMDVGKYHYHNVPQYPFAAKAKESKEEKPKQEKTKNMTRDEIDPQVLSQIQSEARAAERTRLDALDAMSAPGLTDIIAKAKTEGKEPKDIAMECNAIMREQLKASKTVGALQRDAKFANVQAGDAPTPKPVATVQERGANLMANAFIARNPNGKQLTRG